MKKFLLAIFCLVLCLNTSSAAVRDVPNSHWAKNDVDKLVNDYGFMQGDPNGYFGGNKSLTRYEFAKTMSRMIEYYNGELDADRKDIENMVSIMELFQKELKVLEDKVSTVSSNLDEQKQIVNEINEIAITLGEEYEAQSQIEPNDTEKEALRAKLNVLENDLDKLQNKGLFVDTLVKGTYNDIKKLGSATSKVVSSARKNIIVPKKKHSEATSPEAPYIPEAPVEPEMNNNMNFQQNNFNQQGFNPTMNNPNMQMQNPQMQNPNDYYDQMAPANVNDAGMFNDNESFNPYDIEIMEDLGQ
jgi:hypothetical protein